MKAADTQQHPGQAHPRGLPATGPSPPASRKNANAPEAWPLGMLKLVEGSVRISGRPRSKKQLGRSVDQRRPCQRDTDKHRMPPLSRQVTADVNTALATNIFLNSPS